MRRLERGLSRRGRQRRSRAPRAPLAGGAMDEQAQRQLVLTEQNRQLAAQAAAVREELAASEARVQAAREESSSYVEALTLVAR